jgi:hypothetical protein
MRVVLLSPSLFLFIALWRENVPTPLTGAGLLVDQLLILLMMVAIVGTVCILLAPSIVAEIGSSTAAIASLLLSLTLFLSSLFSISRDVRIGVISILAIVFSLINLGLGRGAWKPAVPKSRKVIIGVLGVAALPLLQFWQSTAFLPSQKVTGLAATLNVRAQDHTDTTSRRVVSVITENTSDVRALVILSGLFVCNWQNQQEIVYDIDKLFQSPNCKVYRPVNRLSWIDPKVKLPHQIGIEVPRNRPLVTLTYRVVYARGDRLREIEGSYHELGAEERGACADAARSQLADESRYRALGQLRRYVVIGDVYSHGGYRFQLTTDETIRCPYPGPKPPAESVKLNDYYGVSNITTIWQGWVGTAKSVPGGTS